MLLVEQRTKHLLETRQELKAANQAIELVYGTVIDDKYRLDYLMGQGGMGKIFRVTHIGLKKIFALKLMISSVLDTISQTPDSNRSLSTHAMRFKREAEAL